MQKEFVTSQFSFHVESVELHGKSAVDVERDC